MRLLLLATVAALAAAAPAAAAEPAPPALHDCSPDGVPARCGTIAVPENPAAPSGRKLDLYVVVVPAVEQPAAPDAFAYLAGGPGDAATDEVGEVTGAWSEIHLQHDMLFVDQRGTGGSNDLECTAPAQEVATLNGLQHYLDVCIKRLHDNPAWYGTRYAMDDLDTVRAALGYSSLDLYGTSYGATAAQVFLAEHPHSVRTMILDGGTLLDIPFYAHYAQDTQRALDLLAARCRADARCVLAFPRWRTQFARLVTGWNRKPIEVSGVGLVDGDRLAGVVHDLLLSASSAAVIPLLVSRAAAGDYGPLVAHAAAGTGRTVTTHLMYWSVWCNEPWVGLDVEGPWHTLFDGFTEDSLRTALTICPLLPTRREPAAEWRTPRSQVPVLALVGGADPQDPVSSLAGLRKAMPASRIVVVPGLGHAIGGYGCLGNLVAQFVDDGTARGLDTACARAISPPPFVYGS